MRDGGGLVLEVHPTLVHPAIIMFYIVYNKPPRADAGPKKSSPFQLFVVGPMSSILKRIIYNDRERSNLLLCCNIEVLAKLA